MTSSGTGQAYPTVNAYANLPDPTTVTNQIYVVLTTTGVWPTRKSAGFYYSTGAVWSYLGDFSPSYIRDLYESNADVNRFSDFYKAKLDAAAAGEVLIPMNCGAGDAVGQLVIPDITTDNTVTGISSDIYDNLVFGLIHDKPTATTCNVQVSGSYTGAYTFTRGLTVYVGADGVPTTTPPPATAGTSLQVIGTAFSSVRFVVDVAKNKVVR